MCVSCPSKPIIVGLGFPCQRSYRPARWCRTRVLRALLLPVTNIDEPSGEMRKLVARGDAVLEHDLGDDDAWRDRYRAIACRYVPEPFAGAYIQDTIAEPRALYSLPLANAETSTWRMPVRDGENPLAVWSRQYYHR